MYGIKDVLDYMPTPFYFKTDEIKDYFISKRDEYVTNGLLFYSKIKTDLLEKFKDLQKNNLFNIAFHYCSYYKDFVYSKMINMRIEPLQSDWIASYVLSKRDKHRYIGDEYTLLESYEFVKNPNEITKDNSANIELSFNEICDALDSIVLNSQSYVEGMVKMKHGDNYIYRIFDNDSGHFEDTHLPLAPSKCKFLNVEYTHPLMKKSIFIELDSSVYFADNQILSPTFIKLYLESQPEIYHFDMDYILQIMDDNINYFTLRFDKHIRLTEEGYKVV